MPLKLNEEWQIDADSLNWVLEKRRKKRNEDSYYWQSVGYYSNLSHACEAFLEKKLRASTDSWKDVTLAINNAVDDIRSLCAEVKLTCNEYAKMEENNEIEPVDNSNDVEDEDWGFLE